MLGCYNKVSFIQVCWRLGQAWPRSIPFTLADLNNNYHISKKEGRVKRQEGDAWKLCPGQEKPPLPLSELVDVVGRKEWASFFFFYLSPSITPTNFPLLLSLPSTSASDLVFLCCRTECGEETGEQSAAVWSSSCCLPDQRGNKRGLPGPTLLWRCLMDSQQLGPHSPPCRGQAAGLQGPRVTCPRWTGERGKKY